jgi:hypothetical protein
VVFGHRVSLCGDIIGALPYGFGNEICFHRE